MSELDTARTTVTQWISEYRNAINDTYFTYQDHQWDCDMVSRSNINGMLTIGILNGGFIPPNVQWRDYNNIMIDVNMQFMGGMAISLLLFSEACYSASWIHKANVAQLTDASAVYAYDYMSTLWPDPNTPIAL